MTAPEWIVPGAEVLVHTVLGQTINPVRTRIKKVATKSFTVEAEREPRFSLDDQRSPRQGGTWGGYRQVVPIDSEDAAHVLGIVRRTRLIREARDAVDAWSKDRSRANRLAAIATLEAVEDES